MSSSLYAQQRRRVLVLGSLGSTYICRTSKPFGLRRLHGVHWCMLASQQDMQTPQALTYAPSTFDALTSADLFVVQGAPVYSLN